MYQDNLKRTTIFGAVWLVLQRISSQGVNLLVSFVLARLLTPTDYGIVALSGIFFAIAGALADCGLGVALVQKKDADCLDYNSVFWVGLVLSILVYFVLFASAPLIARFYNEPQLVAIVRVMALSFIIAAVSSVQNAEVTKRMMFGISFRVTLVSCCVSACVGVGMAYWGFGVWALVISQLVSLVVMVAIQGMYVTWRPMLMFSYSRIGPLFKYGWKMSVSGLLDRVFNNLKGLLIGCCYTPADLAFVDRGQQLPHALINLVDGSLGGVSLPVFVLMQDDLARIRSVMRRIIQTSTFCVFPLMVWLGICSKEIIYLLFGGQWGEVVPYMMIACFSFALWPFYTVNLRAIQALGRSDVFLKLEIVKKVLYLGVMLYSVRYGVFAFVMASAALSPISVVINAWPNKKLLGYSISMQIRDVLPTVCCCVVMALAVYFGGLVARGVLEPVQHHSIMCAIMVVGSRTVIGVVAYLAVSRCFRIRPYVENVDALAQAAKGRFPRVSDYLKKCL